jgi:hypothetical protein
MVLRLHVWKNIGGNNGFQIACRNGNLNIVKFFVKNDDQPKDINRGFRNACIKGKFNIVKYLVEQGASVSFYRNALFYACHRQYVDIVQVLVQNGWDVNLINTQKLKVLFEITQHTTPLCILILIEAGVNIERKDIPSHVISIIENRILEITFTKNIIFEKFTERVAQLITEFIMLPITNTSLQNLSQIIH